MGKQTIYKTIQLLRAILGILVNGPLPFAISISIEANRHYNETTKHTVIIYNPVIHIENANITTLREDDT